VAAPLASFFEYLQTDAVERVVKRYQRFAEFRRRVPNVSLFRYEHALTGWAAIAAETPRNADSASPPAPLRLSEDIRRMRPVAPPRRRLPSR